jgi:hypothetical protein
MRLPSTHDEQRRKGHSKPPLSFSRSRRREEFLHRVLQDLESSRRSAGSDREARRRPAADSPDEIEGGHVVPARLGILDG